MPIPNRCPVTQTSKSAVSQVSKLANPPSGSPPLNPCQPSIVWAALISRIVITTFFCLLLAGCATTRSISNSAYRDSDCYARSDFAYHGELSEFDVLGINRDQSVTEEQIRQAAAQASSVQLNRGDRVLLIQSGALIPDGAMVAELSKYFTPVPFSGIPREKSDPTQRPIYFTTSENNYSKLLRLAAARAGAKGIICYWGALESASEKMPTSTISWVPVVKWMVPDQRQYMRLNLKMALIDVVSGNYVVFAPPPFQESDWATRPHRASVDQKQVEELKKNSYETGARQFAQLYVK